MMPAKCPISRLSRRFGPLARTLLCCWSTWCLTGCLLPQDEAVFPDLPPARNNPLRIVNWSPSDLETTVLVPASGASSGCATSFSVVVEDPDVADSTQSQWYIDRTANSPSFNGLPNLGGSTVRTIAAPTALLAQLGSSLYLDNQRHVVEVFVTDGQFGTQPGAASRPPVSLPDGGTLQDVAYVDTKAWFAVVQRCE
jgi:hypothetical protein